jgi:hypothetical protein
LVDTDVFPQLVEPSSKVRTDWFAEHLSTQIKFEIIFIVPQSWQASIPFLAMTK